MIDDKKIEAAANRHIDTEYARYNSGEVEEEMICIEGKDSFKAGVYWAINEFLKGLWHDASEEPKERNENIIVLQDEDDEDEGNPLYAGLIHARHDTFPWDEFCEDNDIYKWCYFKEIAPRKGGEQ